MQARAIRNVVLHGPESTGKSTLAAALAAHYGTVVVPEYGRQYCEEHGTDLGADDLVRIMRGHVALTEQTRREAAKRGRDLIISDTDPLMTAAWALMMFGRRLPELDAFEDTGDLYLLMLDDIPWNDDGLRLHRTREARARFMQLSHGELDRRGVNYAVIGGVAGERLARALAAIDNFVAT